MLVTLQFPIADARGFDAYPDLRLGIPDWPDPATGVQRQFVNHFGPAVERRRDPDLSYPDEKKFCFARRALRFASTPVDCAFRRLLSDGAAVVRTEIGLRPKRGAHAAQATATSEACLAFVASVCAVPTLVGGEAEARPVIRQGNALARLFARATTPRRAGDGLKRAMNLVEAGTPLIVVELDAECEWPNEPAGFTVVEPEKIGGAALHFGRLATPFGAVPLWILQAGADRAQGRLLRLCLLRLHAEQEALDLMIKQMKRGRIPRDGPVADDTTARVTDLLDRYFNEKTRLLKREEWHGLSQSAVLAAFDAAESVTPASTRLTRAQGYAGARQQVWKKLEDYAARRAAIREVKITYVQKGGTVVETQYTTNVSGTGNIVNVAQYMSDVKNSVNNNLAGSEANDQVRDLLTQLTQQLEAISTKVEPKVLKQMGQDLTTLSAEVSSPEPRRKWYELTLNGLKEAAEAVGEIATPIIATVKKLVPLLLGVP
jgi:hypothetical protein